MIVNKPKPTKSTLPHKAPKVPDPRPIVTKWFIAKDGSNDPYDERIFDNVDDAHKARDALGDNRKGTYIHSFNKEIGK